MWYYNELCFPITTILKTCPTTAPKGVFCFKSMKSKLNWISVGVSLASIHYGLGFLVGSGEAIFNQGSVGIIYAIASAFGIFSLTFIAPFYLKEKFPIWDLMGKRYGSSVRKMVASLSGIWMIGIVASQILGGSWALSLFGFNNLFSMVIISVLIFSLSVVNISRLSKIFFYMLIFSSITLLMILNSIGVKWIGASSVDLLGSVGSLTLNDFVGIVLTTVLVTFIGMDFHQFLVRAKDVNEAKKGIVLGGTILLLFSILLLSIVMGSIQSGLVGSVADAKQTVPAMLLNFGNSISRSLGIVFLLPVVFVSIGSGGGVARIVAKTISDLDTTKKINMDTRLLTVVAGFLIALTGGSIIGLIVSFYAIYVASVFVPFLLYLLDRSHKLRVSSLAIRNSILTGLGASLFIFVNQFVPGSFLINNRASYITLAGSTFSIIGYYFSSVFYKNDRRTTTGTSFKFLSRIPKI